MTAPGAPSPGASRGPSQGSSQGSSRGSSGGSSPAADRPRVVLGVGGGIAAYKACELLRLFTESGHDVRVVPTRDALRFVGAPTWAALSGHPVSAEVWDDVHEVPHVRIGQEADLVVVAPATADLLAKAAHGLAGDLLTGTLLTARCPVVFAPAMHTEMWEHPATRANVATLRERGSLVLDPAVGRLTGADTGRGRLPDPADIFAYCREVLASNAGSRGGRDSGVHASDAGVADARASDAGVSGVPASDAGVSEVHASDAGVSGGQADLGPVAPGRGDPASGGLGRGVSDRGDLAARRVVVTAGGTREAIDPVRFIGNRSSGLQGYALAETAAARGAEVTLISANVALADPEGVKVIRVESALDMRAAVLEAATHADAVVMAAAVADFRPAVQAESKIKKSDAEPEPIHLVKNPDILAELCDRRRDGDENMPPVIVGFAAETDDVLANGRAKLRRKGCDLLVVNQVGANLAFGTPDNAAVVLGADGSAVEIPKGPKHALATVVWDLVAARLPEPERG
ncbi:bifunctional phosphopantothenoylcysteine decarboxylase/phosphopantothenate synthase [Thermopolyspora sp. NPDC052614]|uniref:bifunctional phosphopantothenoylcysteine decarboxylase/phosphopantothenate synthase n=1 Tax=Thermopolyspora sp. NPDC052614 TaxID=3155682 RepID=UPI00343A2AB5